MHFRARAIIAFVVLAITLAGIVAVRSARGQADSGSASTALLPSYRPAIDSFMDFLSKGKIDDALATIDFYHDQPDAKDVMRNRLIRLYSTQHYSGYDIVAIQRFSPRLQDVAVLTYYDQQPVLFHFDFYHADATGNQPWLIPGFSMHDNVVDDLKDVPVDYHPTGR